MRKWSEMCSSLHSPIEDEVERGGKMFKYEIRKQRRGLVKQDPGSLKGGFRNDKNVL